MSFSDDQDFEICMLKGTFSNLIKKIEKLKQENKILKEKYEALVERIIDAKLKKRIIKMTPEQEEIVEMFRMDL
jgi:cell division septum initiation protein DivIVA